MCYITSYEHVNYHDTIHYRDIFATIDRDSDSSTIAQHYLYLRISTCFILDVLYKSLNRFLKFMTALECVVCLFSVVSFA